MHATHADKWTVWLMSLLAPGAGQLFASHPSFWLWCVAAGTAIAGAAYFTMVNTFISAIFVTLWVLIAGASASHAKRSLEFRPPWPPTQGVTACVRSEVPRHNRIRLGFDVDIPRPIGEVWPRVARVESFLCIDPFHTRVVPLDGHLKPDTELLLEHHTLGLHFVRRGRLLRWREGAGYSFSDLSARSPRRGFPHVFHVALRSLDNGNATRLSIDVRGAWTSQLVPARCGMLWFGWVMREHARLLRAAM